MQALKGISDIQNSFTIKRAMNIHLNLFLHRECEEDDEVNNQNRPKHWYIEKIEKCAY
jgi:hypothetical protein